MPQPKNSGVDFVEQAISQAKEIEYERGKLAARVDANRQLLRLLDGNQMLTEDQGAWLDVFYPVRTRGDQRSRESVAETQALRKAARSEIAELRGEDAPDTEDDGDDS